MLNIPPPISSVCVGGYSTFYSFHFAMNLILIFVIVKIQSMHMSLKKSSLMVSLQNTPMPCLEPQTDAQRSLDRGLGTPLATRPSFAPPPQ